MSKDNSIGGLVVSLLALLATVAFLLAGFLWGAWHPAWVLFLIIPVVAIVVDILTKKRDVSGAVTGIVALLCVIAYFLMGSFWGLWHPGWIIFFAIPISGVIVKMFTGGKPGEKEEK